jgi:hypothetical protein
VRVGHYVPNTNPSLSLNLPSLSLRSVPAAVIIKEIQEVLALHVVPLKFTWVSRVCNRIAHELAHSGLVRDPDQPAIWSDPLPNFVLSLLDHDYVDPEFGD